MYPSFPAGITCILVYIMSGYLLHTYFCVVCTFFLLAMFTARAAAHRRVLPPSQPACSSDHTFSPSHHFLSLATLCTRVVILHSSRYGMPSCSHVSPVLAQRLLSALKKEKKLNSKTLTAFYGWYVEEVEGVVWRGGALM